MRSYALAAVLALTLPVLTGCDMLGIESSEQTSARAEADSKAIGSACRHAMRAIEDCYTLNPKSQRAAVFAGWREMDEYMRENKLDGVAPVVPRKMAKKAGGESANAETADAGASSAAEAHAADDSGHKAKEDKHGS